MMSTERAELMQQVRDFTAGQRKEFVKRIEELRGGTAGRGASTGRQRLGAYYTLNDDQPEVTGADLRAHLRKELPSFMIPAHFVRLDEIPRTPNGKVDRLLLGQHPRRSASVSEGSSVPEEVPAVDSEERRILAVWREVLGHQELGVHDHFFESGGDSILAIQVISKLTRAGLEVALGDLFRAPTVAQLAEVVRSTTGATPVALPTLEVGAVIPLTPIQQWFFEQEFTRPEQWPQELALSIPRGMATERLSRALQLLVDHHSSLRLAFVRKGGEWQQSLAEGSARVRPSISLDGSIESQRRELVQDECRALHASHGLESGCLIRAAHFTSWSDDCDLLVVSGHHLAFDAISWRIVKEDLVVALREEGAVLQTTLPFSQWAHALDRYAQAEVVREELSYWTGLPFHRVTPLPRELDGGGNTEGSARRLQVSLTPAQTAELLQKVVPDFRSDVRMVVLASLLRAMVRWSGSPTVMIGAEGHGREDLGDGSNLSRSTGWFTTFFPLVFDFESGASLSDVHAHVKEQVRGVPSRGLGYGLLRYMTTTENGLSAHPTPEVIVNHLGRLDAGMDSGGDFAEVELPASEIRSPELTRTCLLEFNSWIKEDCLHLVCVYSANVHREESMASLMAETLEGVTGFSALASAEGGPMLTPTDFSSSGLNQDDLDQLLGGLD